MFNVTVAKFDAIVTSIIEYHRWIIVGLFDGTIIIYDIETGQTVEQWKQHTRKINTLVPTSDKNLVSASSDRFVKKWDIYNKTEIWSKKIGIPPIYYACELNNGYLVIGGDNHTILVLDGTTGNEIMVCKGHHSIVNTVISLRNNHPISLFASGSDDETIRVWSIPNSLTYIPNDIVPHARTVQIIDVNERVGTLSLSPDGHFVATGCDNGVIKMYQLPNWNLVWEEKPYNLFVWRLAWSPYGQFFISRSESKMPLLKIHSTDTGRTLKNIQAETSTILFSQDGTKFFTIPHNNTILEWHIFEQTEKKIRALCEGLIVDNTTDFERDALREVIKRTKRLWELDTD